VKQHFSLMARYNRWANARLYAAAADLPEGALAQALGLYFGSLLGTLNHLLVADRIWMHRLERSGEHPSRLDAIVEAQLAALRAAREAEDERIVHYVGGLGAADLAQPWDYSTLAGVPQRQPVRDILAHLFNHQTHHRGQAHAALSLLGVAEPPPLDLLIMMRQEG
jgi:uncharacterized damage-inducible protein DinB